jgi:hypothetical protein
MANPIIKIKRGTGAPSTTLQAGELAVDQTNENLYIGLADGSGTVTNQIIGGKGTFARKDANDIAFTGGSINGTTIGATTPSTGAFTTLESSDLTVAGWAVFAGNVTSILNNGDLEFSVPGGGMVQGLRAPSDPRDAANKQYVDDEISKLGTVFHYVGILGSELSDTTLVNGAFDLTKLSDQSPGSYYTNKDVVGLPTMVDQAFSDGVVVFNLKEGDSILKTATSWEKLDHVDAVVIPLDNDNEVSVSGNEQIGYSVGLASAFKTRVSDVESKTQNIDLAGTTAGNTLFNGSFVVKGNNTDDAFSVTPSGEVSIGAPGADIYLDRPTYADKSLNVKGKLTVDQGADPYVAPEFAVKDLYGGEVVNINGDSSSIVFGDGLNPNTKVTVHKAFEVITNGSIPDISISVGLPVKINESTNTQTWNGYGTLDIQAGGGLMTAGGEEIGVQTNGALVCNNATPMPIEGFVIDGGVY